MSDAELLRLVREAQLHGIETIYRHLTVGYDRYGIGGILEFLRTAARKINLWPRSLSEIAAASFLLDQVRLHLSDFREYLEFVVNFLQCFFSELQINSFPATHLYTTNENRSHEQFFSYRTYSFSFGPLHWEIHPALHPWGADCSHAGITATLIPSHPEHATCVAQFQGRPGNFIPFHYAWRFTHPEILFQLLNNRPVVLDTQEGGEIESSWRPRTWQEWQHQLNELQVRFLSTEELLQLWPGQSGVYQNPVHRVVMYKNFYFLLNQEQVGNSITILWDSHYAGIRLASGLHSPVGVWRVIDFYAQIKQWLLEISEIKWTKDENLRPPSPNIQIAQNRQNRDLEAVFNKWTVSSNKAKKPRRTFNYQVIFRNNFFQGVLPFLVPTTRQRWKEAQEPEEFGPFKTAEAIASFLAAFQYVEKSQKDHHILTYTALEQKLKEIFIERNELNYVVRIDTHDPDYPYIAIHNSADYFNDFAVWIGKKRKRKRGQLGWTLVPTYSVDLDMHGDFTRLNFAKTPETIVDIITSFNDLSKKRWEEEERANREWAEEMADYHNQIEEQFPPQPPEPLPPEPDEGDEEGPLRRNPKKRYRPPTQAELQAMRDEYAEIRSSALPSSNEAFDEAVQKLLARFRMRSLPKNYVAVAKRVALNRLRYLYKHIRQRSLAKSNAHFDAAVKQLLESRNLEPTPTNWVLMAREVAFPCPACDKGIYQNGSECYRCEGKGVQNDEDVRRNFGYDARRRERGE